MGRPLGSPNKDKPYKEALRMEAAALASGKPVDVPRGSLRSIARGQLLRAADGDTKAADHVSDRLDGKPAQESMVTIDDKRDATDWKRDELVEILNDARARGERAAEANGRDREPDSVH